MAVRIRLARHGRKKRPFYRIVAADSRMPRDGRFIEKLGTYNPLLPKDSEDRVKMDLERIQHWLDKGAQPTDRIARMLEAAGARTKTERNNPNKGTPGKIPGPVQPDGTTSCSPPELLGKCDTKCAQAKWKTFGNDDGPICGVPGCT